MRQKSLNRAEKVLEIKLKREQVRACHIGRTSGSFSYPGNISGRKAIIFCTDDAKRITDRFVGFVKRASRKSRPWVLIHAQELSTQ